MQVAKGDGPEKPSRLIEDKKLTPGRFLQTMAHLVRRGTGGDGLEAIVHQSGHLDGAGQADVLAAFDGDPPAFIVPGEKGTAEHLLGHHTGDHRGDHHGDGQLIVTGHLENHQDGRYGRPEHGAGHRTHADHRIGAIAGGEVREHRGGNNPKGTADHGPDKQRR